MLRKYLSYFSLTLILALLLSAVGPTTVYADDGTPPDTATAETSEVEADGETTEDEATETQADESASGEPEVAPTETPVSDESPSEATPTEEAPATESVPEETSPETPEVQEPASEEPAIEEGITEQVPENTTVVVVNSEGEVEPLATQEAADAVATSDPIWCPAGQPPSAGANGCTDSFGSFDALLNFLKANENDAAYQQAGIIYVEMGTYTSDDSTIDFNTYGYNNLNNYDLTIEGGWDTSDDTIDTDTGTTLNVSFSIGTEANPWIGSLTFNNLSIQDLINGNALTAYSVNDVTLSNIEITNIQNGTAATLVSEEGDVTISDSEFSNSDAGAIVKAGGNVDISDSTFNNNEEGLASESDGYITLYNVEANNNGKSGANITAGDFVDISNSFFSGNAAYVGSHCGGGTYYGYGLQVVTLDAVYLSEVTANDNYLFGAHLEAAIEVDILDSVFDNNGTYNKKNAQGNGLEIESAGIVTIENVQANGNYVNGAIIEAVGDVEVIDSAFSNNGKGLEVKGSGYVSLYNVEANNNREFGADITADKSVAISNSFFSGNAAYTSSYCGCGTYSGYGLQVVSLEDITLDQVVANDNYLFGASLEAGSDVTILDSTFSNNGSDSTKYIDGKGLEVKSGGYVTLYNVEANNNRKFGADITANEGVAIGNSFFSGNRAYVGSHCGGGTYYGYGLQVVSLEDIALEQVVANDNYLFGASLEAGLDVAISDSTFSNNGSDSTKSIDGKGLEVKSGGYVSLYNVEANNNRKFGADITANESVAIRNSFFSGNAAYTCSYCGGGTYYGYGLQVVALEEISLDQVAANDNYLFGASLEAGLDVFISDSTFNNNGSNSTKSIDGKGLEIKSGGFVSLDNVEANNNRKFGADITANEGVNISSSFFSGNRAYTSTYCGCGTYYGYGLQVVSQDAVYLSEVTANDNYLFGAHLEAATEVDILDSIFNDNGTYNKKSIQGNGLEVESDGIVTMENVQASGNYVNGAVVEAVGNVDVSDSTFNNNQKGTGLSVTTSSGEITLDNVTALNNGQDGAYVKTSCANVYVIGGDYSDNGKYGLSVIDSLLNLSDSPSFANNGSGNIFEDSSCFSNGDTGGNPDDGKSDNHKKHGNHWEPGYKHPHSYRHWR